MSKRTVKHAKGFINNRFFIAMTESVGKSTMYIALEKTNSGWFRHCVSRDKLGVLYRKLKATA